MTITTEDLYVVSRRSQTEAICLAMDWNTDLAYICFVKDRVIDLMISPSDLSAEERQALNAMVKRQKETSITDIYWLTLDPKAKHKFPEIDHGLFTTMVEIEKEAAKALFASKYWWVALCYLEDILTDDGRFETSY
jgi:hypothetical protein